MRTISRIDTFLTSLYFLVIPLLLFTTASILSLSISNNALTAFYSGFFGSIIGVIITLILRKFVFMTVFEIPPVLLIISYIIYVLFFYTLLQGLPFLILVSGVFVGLYFKRSFVVLRKPLEEYEYKVFQLSYLTSVTIGILSLFTSCILYFHLSDLDYLKQLQVFVDSLPRPIAALVLISCCAVISLIQFLLTKFSLLFKRPR